VQLRYRILLLLLGIVGIGLPFMATPLIAQDPLHPADAIVVIGGDHKPDRVAHAVQLYEQGYAPIVILSAGNVVWEGGEQMAEAEVLRRQAIALGLPPEVILMEAESQNTRENALFTRQLSEAHKFKSLLLVTSTYHSRRARHIFLGVFSPDSTITISTQPAPPPFCSQCWLFFPDYTQTVFYEYYNWVGLVWVSLFYNGSFPKKEPEFL
jgi:uncharacterized SAM-binding protein YcdF (DUF218 family)